MDAAAYEKELEWRDRRNAELEKALRQRDRRIAELEKRLADLEAALQRRSETNASKKPRFAEDYCHRAVQNQPAVGGIGQPGYCGEK